tara:strand:- start:15 stop:962 length:948 start_codon:yes stop_codon:yes gene_type:complete
MKLLKPNFWSKGKFNLYALALLPLSFFLQLIIFVKKKIVKPIKFNIKIICVGNIYIGGTGKTPLCIKINEILTKKNKETAIIKKFYKNHYDEIDLLKKNVKNLFVNSSRKEAINVAIKNKCDVAILDDGLQDYSISKDLKIVCFTSKQWFGNRHTIPSGPLREPLKSIEKFNIVMVNINDEKHIQKINMDINKIKDKIKIYHFKYELKPEIIDKFKNKKLFAFAGIGNPNNFFDLLDSSGLNLEKKLSFPDHYNYSENEIKKLLKEANNNNLELITTEKDYLRLKEFNLKKINFMPIDLKIFEEDKFIKEIEKYI